MTTFLRNFKKVARPFDSQILPRKIIQNRNKHKYAECNVYKDRLCKAINAEELKELQKKNEENAKKSRSFLESIFGAKKPKEKACPTIEKVQQFEDVSAFVEKMKIKDAKLSKSEGNAYMLEMPFRFGCQRILSKEEKLLHKIEKKKKNEFVDRCDPIPTFANVGQRLIELQKRGLHPLYKKYEEPYTSKITQFNYECPFRRLSAKEKKEDTAEEGNEKAAEEKEGQRSAKGEKIVPEKIFLREKLYFVDYKKYFLPKHISDRLNQIEINLQSPLEFLKKDSKLKPETKIEKKPNNMICK